MGGAAVARFRVLISAASRVVQFLFKSGDVLRADRLCGSTRTEDNAANWGGDRWIIDRAVLLSRRFIGPGLCGCGIGRDPSVETGVEARAGVGAGCMSGDLVP